MRVNAEPTDSELRIRREIRAMVWPLLAATSVIVGLVATTRPWSVAIYVVFALACLARWQVDRPRLPGDEPVFLSVVRGHPWLVLLTVSAASALGIGLGSVPFNTGSWWGWALVITGASLTAGLIAALVFGRRNHERAKEAA